MPVIQPPTINAGPTQAIQRGDRNTFGDRLDENIRWQIAAAPQMVAVAQNVAANAADAAASATSANNASIAAAAAATAANTTANAVPFVANTVYAKNQATISQINFQSYRRRSAGSGPTDPASDPVNWAPTSASVSPNTSATATSAVDINLTVGSAGLQTITMTALGKSVVLPDATTAASVGGPLYILRNAGAYPFGIRSTGGALLSAVLPGGVAYIALEDKSTAAGVWNVSGDNLEPGLITIDAPLSSTYASGSYIAVSVSLDQDTSIHFLKMASGFAAVVVDNAGKVLSTPVAVTALSSTLPVQAFKINATQAMVFFANTSVSSTAYAVVLTLTGASPSYSLSVGTVVSGGGTVDFQQEDSRSEPKFAQLSSNLYICAWVEGSGPTHRVAAISFDGTNITIGAVNNLVAAGSANSSVQVYALTATTAVMFYIDASATPLLKAVILTVTGTTVAGSGTAAATFPAGVANIAPGICQLTASKFILSVGLNNAAAYVIACSIVGGVITWYTAISIAGLPYTSALAFNADGATRFNRRLTTLSATTALLWYFDSSARSNAVVITENAGALSLGAVAVGTIATAFSPNNGGGLISQVNGSDFFSLQQRGTSQSLRFKVVTHKISGTSIVQGNQAELPTLDPTATVLSLSPVKLANGDSIVFGGSEVPVIRGSGAGITVRGTVKIPYLAGFGKALPATSGNRVVLIGAIDGPVNVRLINLEIAV